MKGKTLLKGHTLLNEGKAVGRAAGAGLGGCSCGARSEELPSNVARQRWHKQHKDEIRAERKEI